MVESIGMLFDVMGLWPSTASRLIATVILSLRRTFFVVKPLEERSALLKLP